MITKSLTELCQPKSCSDQRSLSDACDEGWEHKGKNIIWMTFSIAPTFSNLRFYNSTLRLTVMGQGSEFMPSSYCMAACNN